jgi:hypothetical protein
MLSSQAKLDLRTRTTDFFEAVALHYTSKRRPNFSKRKYSNCRTGKETLNCLQGSACHTCGTCHGSWWMFQLRIRDSICSVRTLASLRLFWIKLRCYHTTTFLLNFGRVSHANIANSFMLVRCFSYSSTLKMEVTCSSETSVDFQRTTQRYIPEYRSLQPKCEVVQVLCWNKNILRWYIVRWLHVRMIYSQVEPTRIPWTRQVLWQCSLGRALLCSIEKNVYPKGPRPHYRWK